MQNIFALALLVLGGVTSVGAADAIMPNSSPAPVCFWCWEGSAANCLEPDQHTDVFDFFRKTHQDDMHHQDCTEHYCDWHTKYGATEDLASASLLMELNDAVRRGNVAELNRLIEGRPDVEYNSSRHALQLIRSDTLVVANLQVPAALASRLRSDP